jgi:hypothetical protein
MGRRSTDRVVYMRNGFSKCSRLELRISGSRPLLSLAVKNVLAVFCGTVLMACVSEAATVCMMASTDLPCTSVGGHLSGFDGNFAFGPAERNWSEVGSSADRDSHGMASKEDTHFAIPDDRYLADVVGAYIKAIETSHGSAPRGGPGFWTSDMDTVARHLVNAGRQRESSSGKFHHDHRYWHRWNPPKPIPLPAPFGLLLVGTATLFGIFRRRR